MPNVLKELTRPGDLEGVLLTHSVWVETYGTPQIWEQAFNKYNCKQTVATSAVKFK